MKGGSKKYIFEILKTSCLVVHGYVRNRNFDGSNFCRPLVATGTSSCYINKSLFSSTGLSRTLPYWKSVLLRDLSTFGK